MKKHSFLAGMFTAALIGSLGFTALAATGTVSFNASALKMNGQQISAAGENYTLANGQSVPASITYTDEKGGGTTYLPVRRVSELMGIEVGWDGAVTITGDVKTATSEPTTPPTDYSDWSKEDEAAYQEFKGLWDIKFKDKGDVKYRANGSYENTPWESYILTGQMSYIECCELIKSAEDMGFVPRLAYELRSADVMVELYFVSDGSMILPIVVK